MTIQGLQLLLQLTDELYVYHDENSSHSFHPKVYIFEKEEEQAKVYIGSSNLTSGGLFTNYEMNVELDFDLEDSDDSQLFKEIKSIFENYTDTENNCCKLLDEAFLEQLIERNLLEDEEVRSTASIGSRGQTRPGDVEALFGTGSVRPAPLPYRESVVNTREEVLPEEETETPDITANILIRLVPYAKGRTSQVHFTRSIVEDYFGFTLGGSRHLRFQQFRLGRLKEIEERPLVYSKINKNAKIELSGAKRLSDIYPSGSRPILIFHKIEEGFFRYMLILPEDDGFSELTSYLATVPQHGLALKYDIIDLRTMSRIWSRYPIEIANL